MQNVRDKLIQALVDYWVYHARMPEEIWFVDCRNLHIELVTKCDVFELNLVIKKDRYYDTFRGIPLVDYYTKHGKPPPVDIGDTPGVFLFHGLFEPVGVEL